MGILDRLKELRTQRDAISGQRWTSYGDVPRAFTTHGDRTSEHTVSEQLVKDAMGVVEHEYSSDISYCASYEVGAAIKRCVLRYLDKQIARLVKECKAELDAAAREVAKWAGGG